MEELLGSEVVALAFNVGIVLALVQVLKVRFLPILKASAPWAIPLVASVIGFGASFVLVKTGIDITPIAGVFSGFAASGVFAVGKEISGLKRKKKTRLP